MNYENLGTLPVELACVPDWTRLTAMQRHGLKHLLEFERRLLILLSWIGGLIEQLLLNVIRILLSHEATDAHFKAN